MKAKSILSLVLAGCLLAGVSGAQMTPGMHSMAKTGQAKKGMMAGGVMKKCEAMMAEREGMRTDMKSMDESLDRLVSRMDAASGDQKVAAMGAVIGQLVSQRKTMHEMAAKMDSRMMGHMMEHMRQGTMQSMAACPMMKSMAGDSPNRMSSGLDDHPAHHQD